MDWLLLHGRLSYDGRVSSDAFGWLLVGTFGAFAVILVVFLMRPTVRTHLAVRMALVLPRSASSWNWGFS